MKRLITLFAWIGFLWVAYHTWSCYTQLTASPATLHYAPAPRSELVIPPPPTSFDFDPPTGTTGGTGDELAAPYLAAEEESGFDWERYYPAWHLTAALALWWLVATTARIVFLVIANAFGFVGPGSFRLWLALWPLAFVWRFAHRRLWQPLAFWWEELFRFRIRATAGFASVPETMTLTYKPEMVYLGRLRAFGVGWWQSCGLKAQKHLVMLAGTGGGKTTLLITLAGLHGGNAFVIDPKGQMAKVLARKLASKRKVCVLDPRRIVRGQRTATWNPFDEIARAVERQRRRNEWEIQEAHRRGVPPPDDLPRPEDIVVIYVMKIADGLVVRHGKESPFWTNSAKDFLVGLILFVYLTEPPERRNLVRLYDLLCNGLVEKTPPGRNGFDVLLYEMTRVQAFGGIVAGSANTLANAAKETRGSILSTMSEALKWLKNPAVRNICQSSSFSLEELKTGRLTLFLCAPVSDIRVEMAGWFRLITVLSLTVFEELQHEPIKTPCLYALDEFPSLGRIDAIESSAAVMRSYGIRLLCIAQDIGQIKNLYDNWQTFVGSAAAVWYMAISDPDTLGYLQNSLGRARISRKLGRRWWKPFAAEPPRVIEDEHTVMTADQIERFLSPRHGNMIVQRSGERPLKLKVAPYFKTLPITAYDPDTDFPEARLRAWLRRVLRREPVHAPRPMPTGLPAPDHSFTAAAPGPAVINQPSAPEPQHQTKETQPHENLSINYELGRTAGC